MSMHPNSPPQLTGGSPRRTPAEVASLVGDYVRSGIRVVFWLIAASITAAAAFLAVRIILWAVQLASKALGL
jgi:hypothetical protein